MSTPAGGGGPRMYGGWRRERFGWFLGLTGWQVVLSAVAVLPVLLAVGRSHWAAAVRLAPLCAVVIVLVVVPVRGRPAARWLADVALFACGRVMDWSRWRCAAATGALTAEQAQRLDLPGVLAGLRLHDGPPFGPAGQRVCVLQDPRAGRWSAVARVVHPGVGAADEPTRAGYAEQLGELLAAAARGEQISRVSILVRTVPDDGAQRATWVAEHAWAGAPQVVGQIGAQLEQAVLAAAVRHEVYVTVAVAERRVRRQALRSGGGVLGRARVLYRNLQEIEGHLRGLGATAVRWLHTEDVAAAIRTGYNPAEAATLHRAGLQRRSGQEHKRVPHAEHQRVARGEPERVPRREHQHREPTRGRAGATVMPPGLAGPVNAPPPPARSYCHDAYTTVSYALLLPELPTRVGALAYLLAPAMAGERRSLALHYEPLPPAAAGRQVERDIWTAQMAAEVRQRRGFRIGRAQRRRQAETAAHEGQLVAGHTMVRVAAAAAVTVPSGWPVEDHAARFEAAARGCHLRLLRLELAQDTGFVAACLPLGVGLAQRGTR